MNNGMQGHSMGDAAWHREQFSPAKHGEHVGEVFNRQRVEQLEARVAELESALDAVLNHFDIGSDDSRAAFNRGMAALAKKDGS